MGHLTHVRILAKQWWRRVRQHCRMCGGPKGQHSTKCFHCASDPSLCHVCNKRLNFARLYGANKAFDPAAYLWRNSGV